MVKLLMEPLEEILSYEDGFALPGTECNWYGLECEDGNITLGLSGNQLTGSIPVELMNMTSLLTLNICDNHLYTTNPDLRNFLTNLQPGWESCQKRSMPWILLLLLGD